MSLDENSGTQSAGKRFSRKGLPIGGKWQPSSDGKTFDVLNPATGTVWAEVADASRDDAKAAIEAAAAAQPAWAAMSFYDRAVLLGRVADVLERRKDEFIAALTAECGGWVRKSMFEISYAPTVYRAAAAEAYKQVGETLPSDHHKVSMVERTPLGVVSVISPWNVPLLLSSRGMAWHWPLATRLS
jgi:aldehyde dehydrogenase (NAD+)